MNGSISAKNSSSDSTGVAGAGSSTRTMTSRIAPPIRTTCSAISLLEPVKTCAFMLHLPFRYYSGDGHETIAGSNLVRCVKIDCGRGCGRVSSTILQGEIALATIPFGRGKCEGSRRHQTLGG